MEKTDHELIQAYLKGDIESLSQLVNRHLPMVYTFIFRLVGDQDTASELSQITFVKVWQKLNSFDQTKNFKPWLLTIAKNSTLDELRKNKSVAFSQMNDDHFTDSLAIVDPAPLPSTIFERAELSRELTDHLNQLNTEDKMIILLHHENDLSLTAIADLLGKSHNTVKSRYRRALAKIKNLILTKNAPKETL